MHRDALIANPDLHRALTLSHLHDAPHPFPVDPVAGALPADEAIPRHLPVFTEIGSQGSPARQPPQVGTLLGQHLPGHPVGRSVDPPVGHTVAPFQSLAIDIGVVGEAYAGPHVALHVLHPAFDFALGLGPVRLAQPCLKAHPHGEVQHPLVPDGLLFLVPAQCHHLGIVVKAAPGHAAQVLEGIHVALDEGGGIRATNQLHIAGPGPTQSHHEHPDATLLPVLVQVGQAAPVDLRLLPRCRLESHGGLRLPASPARRHVGLQNRVAAVIAQGFQLPVQHHTVFQPIIEATVDVFSVGIQLGRPPCPRPRPHGFRGLEVPANRVPGYAQVLGDPPDGTARSFHLVDLFHLSHPQQNLEGTSTKSS